MLFIIIIGFMLISMAVGGGLKKHFFVFFKKPFRNGLFCRGEA